MAQVSDFLKENTSTTGTGAISLTGAADHSTGRIRDAWSVSTEVYYSIIDGVNRETGIGTFNGLSTLTRDTVNATVKEGVYNNTTATALDLQGAAIVSCTLSAAAYEAVNISVLNASDIIYIPTSDPSSSDTDAQAALVTHGTAIATNLADIATNTADIASSGATDEVKGICITFVDWIDHSSTLDFDLPQVQTMAAGLVAAGICTQAQYDALSALSDQPQVFTALECRVAMRGA